MAESNASSQVSSGVQELIERLRDEGVQAGRREAERLLAEARQKADEVVAAARAEAEQLLARARTEIAGERAAAREALKLAARDTRLDLKAQISSRFAVQVRQLVGTELRDPQVLRQLVLALGARTGAQLEGEDLRLALPEEVLAAAGEALGEEAAAEKGGGEEAAGLFDRLTVELAAELLREGVELAAGDHDAGVRVAIAGRDAEVDLTDEAVARLLLAHLSPRFRDLMAGMTD